MCRREGWGERRTRRGHRQANLAQDWLAAGLPYFQVLKGNGEFGLLFPGVSAITMEWWERSALGW